MKTDPQSRRDFIKKTGLATGSLVTMPLLSNAAFFNSSADDSIRVALVGCGGRGIGAAIQAMLSKQNVKLVAMADVFKDRLDEAYKTLTGDKVADWSGTTGNVKDRILVKDDTKFVGFDAYMKAIPLADVIILTTPPGFRPVHFEEASGIAFM